MSRLAQTPTLSAQATTATSRTWILPVLAFVAFLATWAYVTLVYIPYTKSIGVNYGAELGHQSDLYASWVGTREILAGRNPYTPEVTRQIQTGFYSAPLPAGDQRDPHAFFYPVHIVFLFAPFALLDFSVLQLWFGPVLLLATGLSALLWLRALDLKPDRAGLLALVLASLSLIGVTHGVMVLQFGLLVLLFVAAAVASLRQGYYFAAGALLAVATVKPQLIAPLLVGLFIWAAFDLTHRRNFLFGFGATGIAMLVGAELVQPGWIPRFLASSVEYTQDGGRESWLSALFGAPLGALVATVLLAVVLALWVGVARTHLQQNVFTKVVPLTMCVTALIIPSTHLYDQVLLLPALLAIAALAPEAWRRGGSLVRYSYLFIAATVSWFWITAALLVLASFVLPVAAFWFLPFQAYTAIPFAVLICFVVVVRLRPADLMRPFRLTRYAARQQHS